MTLRVCNLTTHGVYQSNLDDGCFHLSGISFSLEAGERLAVVGANGSGKSSLLRALADSSDLADGSVDCESGPSDGSLCDFAFVMQDPDVGFICTNVFDEIAFGLQNLGLSEPEIRNRVSDALKACRIANLAGRDVGQLSGGQKQLVSFAAAVAMRPRYLLLDEPFSMLDEGTARCLKRLIDGLPASIGVIVVTHRLDDILGFDSCIALEGGCIIWRGTPPELASNESLRETLGIRELADFNSGLCGLETFDAELAKRRSVDSRESDAALSLESCSLTRGDFKLHGVNLYVRPGELVLLTGASGSGKSSCAYMAAGLIQPDSGSVLCDGGKVKPGDVGMAFQRAQDQLFKPTVLEDVMFGPLCMGMEKGEARRSALNALNQVGFDCQKQALFNPNLLSGGQRRRAGLAGVIAMGTPYLIFDEPTVGLDGPGVADLLKLVEELLGQGKGILIITHEPQTFAGLGNRAYRMVAGTAVGPVEHAAVETAPCVPLKREVSPVTVSSIAASGDFNDPKQLGQTGCGNPPEGVEFGNVCGSQHEERFAYWESDKSATSAYAQTQLEEPGGAESPKPSALDPRVCLLMCAVCSVSVLVVDAPLVLAAVLALSLIVYMRVGGRPSVLAKALALLSLMYALVVVCSALVFDGSADIVLAGATGISFAGAKRGVLTVGRLAALVVFSLTLVSACSEEELMEALNSLLAPLAKLGVPTGDISVMLGLSLRCIPLAFEKVNEIKLAQNARGASLGLSGNPLHKVLSYVPLLAPACIAMFRYAEDFAFALSAKGFTGVGATRMHTRRMRGIDWLVGLGVCLAAVLIAVFF
jgi:energy-coupling factor transporter ATP-binding protein EcfA2/energy-coupling factor transporter transmembrane protein EcfT